jgi:two-component system OmpR family response regulator
VPTILVVDDEAHIRDVLQYALTREGHVVETAPDGRVALERIRQGDIDLVVLDILMPELDGLSLCRRVRETSSVPIIFLSSRAEEVDRILGLELGGDDYVPKPFSPRELATRVRAVLRRSALRAGGEPERGPILVRGTVEVDPERHEVRVAGTKAELTATEFEVLRALLQRPGRLLTRSQLIERAYAGDHHVTERTIDTHIRRIRAKLRALGVDPIETVHGLGYRSTEPE